MNHILSWLRAQSMERQVVLAVIIAIAIGCVAFPVTLHQLTLSRIRETTFDAIRFAAAVPEQLRTLPVTAVQEGDKIAAPRIEKIDWEQYRMSLPRGESSTIIDIDLRSTLLPLMLGFGGWLRIVAIIAMSGCVAWYMMKSWHKCSTIDMPRGVMPDGEPIFASSRASELIEYGESPRVMPTNGVLWRQDPSRQNTSLLQNTIHHIPAPAFFFDIHHQLIHWNESAQTAMPHLTLSAGIHALDLSAHLPWGAEMIEKMDEVAQQPALVIQKGESLCVIPG